MDRGAALSVAAIVPVSVRPQGAAISVVQLKLMTFKKPTLLMV